MICYKYYLKCLHVGVAAFFQLTSQIPKQAMHKTGTSKTWDAGVRSAGGVLAVETRKWLLLFHSTQLWWWWRRRCAVKDDQNLEAFLSCQWYCPRRWKSTYFNGSVEESVLVACWFFSRTQTRIVLRCTPGEKVFSINNSKYLSDALSV